MATSETRTSTPKNPCDSHAHASQSTNGPDSGFWPHAACTSKKQTAIDPKIVPYLAFFPVANGAISGDEAFYNFQGKRIGREHYGMTKIDHNFSTNTTINGSFQVDASKIADGLIDSVRDFIPSKRK